MSDAEEYRKIEKDAQRMSAEVASEMMRRPKRRWIYMPIYRLFKWVEKQTDTSLKEDGWR